MAKKKKKDKPQAAQNPTLASRELKELITIICRWLIWTTIFLALLVPLMVKIGFYFPFISYRSLWFMGVVQVMGVIWLFLAIHNPQYRPKPNLILLALTLFMASITISTLVGADPTVSFWSKHERMTGLLMHLHLATFFLVLVSFIKSEAEWLKLFGISICIAAIVSIWGIADNYNLLFILEFFNTFGIVNIHLAEINKGGSTLGNASFMASYLLINAYIAFYLIIKTGAKWWLRILASGAFIFISLGIILNLRGGDAVRGSFYIGLVLLALLYLAFSYRNLLVNRAALVVLAFGLMVAIYIGLTAFQEGSYARNQIMQMPGIPGRVANWESSWEGFKERPVFGWGPENFEIALQKHYDPRVMLPRKYDYRAEPWHDRAHNVIFDYLVAAGLLGTIFFFSIFAAALYLLWKCYLKDRKIDFWPPAIVTTILAAHFIQNLTVFDMLSSYMLLFVIMAFSATITEGQSLEPAANSKQARQSGEKPVSSVAGNEEKKTGLAGLQEKLQHWLQKEVRFGLQSFVVLLFLTLLLGFTYNYFVHKPYQGSIYTAQAMNEREDESMIDDFYRAIKQSPTGRMQIRRNFSEIVHNRLSRVSDLDPELRDVYIAEADFMINELKKSIKDSPLNYRPYHSLGRFCNTYARVLLRLPGEEGMLEKAQELSLKAEETHRAAIEISPTNPQGYWGLALTLVDQGYLFRDHERVKASLDVLEEAMALEPRLKSSHDMGIRITLQILKDEELAELWLERALEIDPSWERTLRGYFN